MDDGNGVAQKMEPVGMKHADDDDDAPRSIAVHAAASSDGGVDGQVEGLAISGPRSSLGQKRVETSASEPPEEEEESVMAVVRIMLGTPHTASLFAAVGLSGMGAGIIDTFLFIRYVLVGTSTSPGYDSKTCPCMHGRLIHGFLHQGDVECIVVYILRVFRPSSPLGKHMLYQLPKHMEW